MSGKTKSRLRTSGARLNRAGQTRKVPAMDVFEYSTDDVRAIIRLLEQDALAIVAKLPTEAVRLVLLASLFRPEATR